MMRDFYEWWNEVHERGVTGYKYGQWSKVKRERIILAKSLSLLTTPPMPRFRSRARAFIVTYPQCNEDVQSQFATDGRNFPQLVERDLASPECCRIGREQHADGGVHFHVFLSFESPVVVNSPTVFDYFGTHGNIKPVRTTPRRAWEYVGKDGDIIHESGDAPAERGTSHGHSASRWTDIVACDSKESFLAAVRVNAPRDWVLSLDRILQYAEYAYPTPVTPYESPAVTTSWGRAPGLREWLSQAAIGRNVGER
jgi:hypothetical protein